ncbi:hypothetical protein ACJW30_06G062000 [Castanea mollissima]
MISSLESLVVAEIVVEIWPDFGFCGVVFKFQVVDVVVFLGFVVNLYAFSWVSNFGFYGCCFFFFLGFMVNLYRSPWVFLGNLLFLVFFFFFFFFQWWWLGWIWVCWVEMEDYEFVGYTSGYGWLVFISGGDRWGGYGFAGLRRSM